MGSPALFALVAFALAAVSPWVLAGCSTRGERPADEGRAQERAALVAQLERAGVRDERVLAALRAVPRHHYVPEGVRDHAYEDRPLPIGHGQTISQPFIVGFMSQALELDGSDRVLEIGTGSGYQAAILGELAAEVYTIEIVPELAETAARVLAAEGYANVHVKSGDGYRGWPEAAPFDAIIVTAAPDRIPEPLVEQLAVGGRMIVPVGEADQELVLLVKTPQGLERERVLPVLFVPMTGEVQTLPDELR